MVRKPRRLIPGLPSERVSMAGLPVDWWRAGGVGHAAAQSRSTFSVSGPARLWRSSWAALRPARAWLGGGIAASTGSFRAGGAGKKNDLKPKNRHDMIQGV